MNETPATVPNQPDAVPMAGQFDLADPAIQQDPYPAYERLRGTPVVDLDGTGSTFLCSGHQVVSAVLRDPVTFSSQILPLPVLMFLDPPEHDRIRSTVARAFTPRAVAALEARIEHLAHQLLDPYVATGGGDFVAAFAARLPVYVVGEVLGVPTDDFEQLRHWSDDTIRAIGGDPDAAAGAIALSEYLDEVASTAREVTPDSIAARLVAFERDGRLERPELVSFLQFLFVAGHETTMAMFTHGVELLATDAVLRHQVDADRSLLSPFVEEILRTRSPLQRLFRRVTRPTTIGGCDIDEGATVCLLLGAANRDDGRYPTPHDVNLDAADASHLAFGQGIHHCLGAPLARLEGRIGFGALLDHAASWELDPGRPPVRFAGGTTSEFQTTSLHLTVTPR